MEEKRGDLFQGDCTFYIKGLKYLMTKKNCEQKCFSVITKNLNLETLMRNLVTFKRWNRAKGDKC